MGCRGFGSLVLCPRTVSPHVPHAGYVLLARFLSTNPVGHMLTLQKASVHSKELNTAKKLEPL